MGWEGADEWGDAGSQELRGKKKKGRECSGSILPDSSLLLLFLYSDSSLPTLKDWTRPFFDSLFFFSVEFGLSCLIPRAHEIPSAYCLRVVDVCLGRRSASCEGWSRFGLVVCAKQASKDLSRCR